MEISEIFSAVTSQKYTYITPHSIFLACLKGLCYNRIKEGDSMNIGTSVCLFLGMTFLILALIFAIFKGKAALLLSGFNTLSKETREQYDTHLIALDTRNEFLGYAIILLVGAILSAFISEYLADCALVVWLFVFFSHIHVDIDKAFGKYKKL